MYNTFHFMKKSIIGYFTLDNFKIKKYNLYCLKFLYGDVPKWLKGLASNTSRSVTPTREFKSLHLRQIEPWMQKAFMALFN